MAIPRNPCPPASVNSDRGTIPASSPSACRGTTSFSSHRRTLVRNCSCSESKISRFIAGTSSDRHHHFALRLAIRQLTDRLTGTFERVGVRHMRVELAVLPPLEQFRHVLPVTLSFATHERAPEHTDDGTTLQQGEIERDPRDLTVSEADHEEASFPG